MSRNPYLIDGPAVISFSGGRSSAYMLYHIIQAHGGTLPSDVKVAFSNTGKEMPETLDFVKMCSDLWGVHITWLEYFDDDNPQNRWAAVNYHTAHRSGEPYSALIDRKQYLPNPVARFCTIELKIRPMKLWAQQGLGWEHWDVILGIRADEPRRVRKLGNTREVFETLAPLADAGVTKSDVGIFWARQNFDLELPNVFGTTPMGNCDLCFLKSAKTIQRMMRSDPSLADWWIKAEADAERAASRPDGARFRKDRPSYAQMLDAVKRQDEFDFGDADIALSCVTCDIDDAA